MLSPVCNTCSSMSERPRAARRLLRNRHRGLLCTNSLKKAGFPFGSLTPYALSEDGSPIFLLSGLAVHTKNLAADPRASLFVTDEQEDSDALSSARVNVFGTVERLDGEAAAVAKTAYLAIHAEAAQWVEFGDFFFYRLQPDEVYFVGGFGDMGWVAAADYAVATA